MKRLENVDMREYTSFKAGGRAAEMVIVETIEELQDVLREIHREEKKWLMLGNGSNTLISDKGFDGLVVKLGNGFCHIATEDDCLICGTAVLMSVLAKIALREELSGFEPLSGIPGSLGGAVFMNAGAYGGEMKDIVESVTLVSRDGETVRTVKGEDMDFGYRHSILEETGEVAVSVKLKL